MKKSLLRDSWGRKIYKYAHYNYITMVMQTLQIRLGQGLIEKLSQLVDSGLYTNKSDAIRDAVRRLVIDEHIGIVAGSRDSVSEVRGIRERLSKKKITATQINSVLK